MKNPKIVVTDNRAEYQDKKLKKRLEEEHKRMEYEIWGLVHNR